MNQKLVQVPGEINQHPPLQLSRAHSTNTNYLPQQDNVAVQKKEDDRKRLRESEPDYKRYMKADCETLKAFKPNLYTFLTRLHWQTNIFPGFYQLPRLTKILYSQLITDHPSFGKLVPESAFAYYCAVVVYFRLMRLLKIKNRAMSDDEMRFLAKVHKCNLMVPALLQDYVAALGDVTFYNGHFRERYEFSMLPFDYYTSKDKSTGWFGPINEKTFVYYLMYPCLSIYAKRIIQDLMFSIGTGEENWNLPADIAPQEPNAGYPTENLLGYAKAMKLTTDQINFLYQGGISDNCFYTSNDTILLSTSLISLINDELIRLKDVRLNSALCKYRQGSVAQLPIHFAIVPEEPTENYRELDGPFIQKSKYKYPAQLHTAALQFQFQIYFNVKDNYNSWAVYEFNGFTEVPKSWQDNMTAINKKLNSAHVEFGSYDDAWKKLTEYKFKLNASWRKNRRGPMEIDQQKGTESREVENKEKSRKVEKNRRRNLRKSRKERQNRDLKHGKKIRSSTPVDINKCLPSQLAKLVEE